MKAIRRGILVPSVIVTLFMFSAKQTFDTTILVVRYFMFNVRNFVSLLQVARKDSIFCCEGGKQERVKQAKLMVYRRDDAKFVPQGVFSPLKRWLALRRGLLGALKPRETCWEELPLHSGEHLRR